MKIVVTGGAGQAGKCVVKELLDHGHDVRSVDRVAFENAGAENLTLDLMDLDAVANAVAGCEAIVHLAAIPAPRPRPQWPEVWRINVVSTYNVLDAAHTHGVRKVVLASSICAAGFCGGYRPGDMPYLPVDEAYPTRCQEPYSMSKLANEITAKGFTLCSDMEVACMRLGNIRSPHTEEGLARMNCKLNFATIAHEDVAQGFRVAVETKGVKFGIYNLTCLYRYNARGEVETAEEVLGFIRAAMPQAEIRDPEWVFSGKSAFDIRKAMNELGYAPRY